MSRHPLNSTVYIQARVIGRSVGGNQSYDLEIPGQPLLRNLPAPIVLDAAEVAGKALTITQDAAVLYG